MLNRYYNFSQPYSLIFLNWYVGEASTAIYVGNIPLTWPLLKRMFRLGSFTPGSSNREPHSRKQIYSLSGQRSNHLTTHGSETVCTDSKERIIGKCRVVEAPLELMPIDPHAGNHTEISVARATESASGQKDRGDITSHNRNAIIKTIEVSQQYLRIENLPSSPSP